MSNSGSLFGWLITAGLFLTLLNYPVKAIYRRWIAPLPRESKSRNHPFNGWFDFRPIRA